MRVTAERMEPAFNPVEVKLIFDTEKEFNVFLSMLNMNISVPGVVFPKKDFPEQFALLKHIIDDISETMIVCRDKKRE